MTIARNPISRTFDKVLSKEIDVDTLRLTDKLIYIIGPLKLQNEMMASLIEEETEIKCLAVEDVGHIPGLDDKEIDQQKLTLLDCLGRDPELCLTELEQFDRKILDRTFVAFFNVSPRIRFEEEAVARGVRGFFYEQDSFERFPKGVRAIFEGELWVSRKVLSKFSKRLMSPTVFRQPSGQQNISDKVIQNYQL